MTVNNDCSCFRGVDLLLAHEPKLGRTAKNDGFMPLHICAVNTHVNEATLLLVKVQCMLCCIHGFCVYSVSLNNNVTNV